MMRCPIDSLTVGVFDDYQGAQLHMAVENERDWPRLRLEGPSRASSPLPRMRITEA